MDAFVPIYRDTVQPAVQTGLPDTWPARKSSVGIEMQVSIFRKFPDRGETMHSKLSMQIVKC